MTVVKFNKQNNNFANLKRYLTENQFGMLYHTKFQTISCLCNIRHRDFTCTENNIWKL